MFLAPKQYRRKVSITFDPKEDMCEQAHKEACDIHNIMRKYEKTGIIEHVNKYEGTYMDMADAPDYHAAQMILADAKSMFETVPSSIRADFDNDPAKFVTFMQNPENRAEIEAYGLSADHLPPVEPKNTQEVQVDLEQITKAPTEKKQQLSAKARQNAQNQQASSEAISGDSSGEF